MSKSKYLTFAVIMALLGCDDSDDAKKPGAKNGTDGATSSSHRDGGSRSDAGSDDGNDDGNDDVGGGESGGGSNDNGDVGGGESGGGGNGGGNGSGLGSSGDAGGGSVPVPDGGVVQGSGSCCAERDTPGCGDATLEVCVCEKDPTCCTSDWGKRCVFIVEQKYCQDGVRDCVCNTWGKTSCCGTDWTSTCDTVGVSKCNAVQGCF